MVAAAAHGAEDLHRIGEGAAVPDTPLAVLGPGWGLGVACYVPAEASGVVLASEGAFNLTMRLYNSKAEALTGKWNPPPIMKTQVPPTLNAQ